jgi:hypothetical protein
MNILKLFPVLLEMLAGIYLPSTPIVSMSMTLNGFLSCIFITLEKDFCGFKGEI